MRLAPPPRGPPVVRSTAGIVKGAVEAVDQEPGALVVHAHGAGGGGDRAGVAHALQERGLARADAGTGVEDEGQLQAGHAAQRAAPIRSRLVLIGKELS